MSISAHGRSRLYCVWRWTSGLRRSVRPAIHILAGENVCIQAMTPTQSGALSASRRTAAMPSGVVTTGLATIETGIAADSSRHAAIARACSSTRSQDGLAVQVLAARHEPRLELSQTGVHVRGVSHHLTAPLSRPET